MLEFLDVGNRREVYNSAMSQIRLSKINDNNFEMCDYTFKPHELKSQFELRGFESIIKKSWNKWLETMEKVA